MKTLVLFIVLLAGELLSGSSKFHRVNGRLFNNAGEPVGDLVPTAGGHHLTRQTQTNVPHRSPQQSGGWASTPLWHQHYRATVQSVHAVGCGMISTTSGPGSSGKPPQQVELWPPSYVELWPFKKASSPLWTWGSNSSLPYPSRSSLTYQTARSATAAACGSGDVVAAITELEPGCVFALLPPNKIVPLWQQGDVTYSGGSPYPGVTPDGTAVLALVAGRGGPGHVKDPHYAANISLYDATTGALINTLMIPEFNMTLQHAGWGGDGTIFASSNRGTNAWVVAAGMMRQSTPYPQPQFEESLLVLDAHSGTVLWQDRADHEAHWLRSMAVSDDGQWLVLVRPRPGYPAWPVVRVLKRNKTAGYEPFASYDVGNATANAPHPDHVALSADGKWLAVAHRINAGIDPRTRYWTYISQAVSLLPFPPPADGAPWRPVMSWRSPYKPADGQTWKFTNMPTSIAVGATGAWVGLATLGCATPAMGPLPKQGCTGVPTVFAFKRGEATGNVLPAAVLEWSTPGSMYGVAVKELPDGGAAFIAGGKQVHASVQGNGGDVFGWRAQRQKRASIFE